MNIQLPDNSRRLAILAQYVPPKNTEQLIALAQIADTIEQLAYSPEYQSIATNLTVAMNPLTAPEGMTAGDFVMNQIRLAGIGITPVMSKKKHLPGKHDQSAHGRRGRAGTAFRGAYTAARAEGKTHREAWELAKGAANAERGVIREERAAARAARDAERAAKKIQPQPEPQPTPARPPIDQATSWRDYTPDEIAGEIERRAQALETKLMTQKITVETLTFERDAAYAAANEIWKRIGNKYDTDADMRADPEYDTYLALRDQSLDLSRKVNEAWKERDAFRDKAINDFHDDVFKKMRHPDAGQITTKVTNMSAAQRVEALRLVTGVVEMFPASTFAQDQIRGPLTISGSSRRAHYNWTKRQMLTNHSASVTTHEALHYIQHASATAAWNKTFNDYVDSNPNASGAEIRNAITQMPESRGRVNAIAHDWALSRIGGEQPTRLSVLTGNKGYRKDEIAFRDQVDDPYTLKRYDSWLYSTATPHLEVLTMAFTDLPGAHRRTDKGLLRVGIEAILAEGAGK